MIEAEYAELIQRELDGELSETETARLQRYLSEHREARELRAELQKVCAMLERVPAVEPAPNLKKAILNRLPGAGSASVAKPSLRRKSGWLSGGFRFGWAVAFAGGVVIGLLLAGLNLGQLVQTDRGDLSGAMVTPVPPPAFEDVDAVEVALDGQRGRLELQQAGRLAELHVQLPSIPAQVTIEYAAETVALRATSLLPAAQYGSAGLTWTHQNEAVYRLLFERRVSAESAVIRVRIAHAGGKISRALELVGN